MERTKTGIRQRIPLPDEAIQVLRWHIDTQLTTPEQQASDLLFPAEDGGFRNEHCMRRPFDTVSELIGLKIHFTPRGMRRTFNDLMRLAKVEPLIIKSISGHQTEQMREHYSTVQPFERRDSIGRILRLVKSPPTGDASAQSGGNGGGPTPSKWWLDGERRVLTGPDLLLVGATGVEPATPTVSTPPRMAQPQRLRALATRRTPRTAIVISLVFPCLQMIRRETSRPRAQPPGHTKPGYRRAQSTSKPGSQPRCCVPQKPGASTSSRSSLASWKRGGLLAVATSSGPTKASGGSARWGPGPGAACSSDSETEQHTRHAGDEDCHRRVNTLGVHRHRNDRADEEKRPARDRRTPNYEDAASHEPEPDRDEPPPKPRDPDIGNEDVPLSAAHRAQRGAGAHDSEGVATSAANESRCPVAVKDDGQHVRPWRKLSERIPVGELTGREPAVRLDELAVHLGNDGQTSAEADDAEPEAHHEHAGGRVHGVFSSRAA